MTPHGANALSGRGEGPAATARRRDPAQKDPHHLGAHPELRRSAAPVLLRLEARVATTPQGADASSGQGETTAVTQRLKGRVQKDPHHRGHDGNPDRHHFHRGTGPRIQGYRCHRGIVDGEPAPAGCSRTGWGRMASSVPQQHQKQEAPVTNNDLQQGNEEVTEDGHNIAAQHDSIAVASDEFILSLSADWTTTDVLAGWQPASDPMVLEAGLLSECTGKTHMPRSADADRPAVHMEQILDVALDAAQDDPAPTDADTAAICEGHDMCAGGAAVLTTDQCAAPAEEATDK